MRQFYFERMEVWQQGREFIKIIYQLTATFPPEEKYGITSQIRRACVSINSNIAEGVSRQSGKEQARFTEIAYGSLMETLNLLITACDLGFMPEGSVDELRPTVEVIGNKLNSLRQTQLKRV